MTCKYCGAEVSEKGKFCEYCNMMINPDGQDYSFNGTGECFVVEEVFAISGRAMVSGKALQPITEGDFVYFENKKFLVSKMQVGPSIVSSVKAGDKCGLLLSELSKKDLRKGDILVFRKE